VLVSLAMGAFAFASLSHLVSEVTRGYVVFTILLAAAIGALAFLSDTGLPAPTGLDIKPASENLDIARRVGLGDFVMVAIVYALAMRSRWRWLVLAATLISGATALVAAAMGWAQTAVDGAPLAVQLFALSATAGGGLAALILGHWYLVTPRLQPAPLVLQTRLLLGAIALQLLLFVVWTTLGGGPGQAPFDALTGSSALLVWLRLVVTLLFPLALAFMALRTAQTRSMESATGLLYINLAAVLAGTIGAASLYVTGGLLV
jgi:hypothetical protein